MSRPEEFGDAEPRGAESLSSRSKVPDEADGADEADEADEGREVDSADMDLSVADRVGEGAAEEAVEGFDMLVEDNW